MSRLIQLRQRIKAIQTIKKVTHAMRLISMSGHVKLKAKQDYLTNYRQEIANLFSSIKQSHQEKPSHATPSPTTKTFSPAPLIILIGSQKGLCGIFNTALFSFFETMLREKSWSRFSLIPIGKKAVDYANAQSNLTSTIVDTYDTLTTGNHLHIAQKITDSLMSKQDQYSSITVVSNELKSFFIQKPRLTTLLPLSVTSMKDSKKDTPPTSYIWEQSPKEIIAFLTQQYFEASFQYLLFQSLLSEQAARFLSMDNATRNAENLLERTTLDYNKLRQAKITKELTELAGGFQKSG